MTCQDIPYFFILQVQSIIGEKVIYHSVFELFPLTYMCVDNDFRLFLDQKSEKNFFVVLTFFSEFLLHVLSVYAEIATRLMTTDKVSLI